MLNMERLKGRLLVANGSLYDPNFRQTVILVAEHEDEGAVGLVLNRRANVTVAQAAPAFIGMTEPTEPIFIGGPVQPDAAVVLAESENADALSSVVLGGIGVLGHEPDDPLPGGIERVRIFAGYAGWGPGQLENELEESSWIVVDALPEDVFTGEPDKLWSQVLRRKGGSFAMLATMPYDPSHN
jgi:putative transcriptional regulator